MGVNPHLTQLFNAWCQKNLGGKTVAELNDVDAWTPQNFEQAWNRFLEEAATSAFQIEI